MKLKMVYQTSINAPRQKTQAIVKQAAAKAGIEIEIKSVTASVYFSSDVANPDTYSHFYTDIQMYTTTMTQPDPELFMLQFTSGEVATKDNKWQGTNITRWKNDEYDKLFRAAEAEMDPVKRAALFIKMNDLVIQNVVVIPVVWRPRVAAVSNRLAAPSRAAGTRTSGTCTTGTTRGRRPARGPGRRLGPPGHPRMSKYLIRRLLIAIPVLAGISLVLFTILAWRPAIPSRSSPPTRTCPPEVRANLRAQFGLDDPIPIRYARWFTSMLRGRLGLLLRQPHRRGHAHPAAPAHHALRPRLGPAPGPPRRAARSASTPRCGPTPSSTRSRPRSRSSASPCRRSSPGSSSSCSSASTSTGCRSSTAPTSAPPGSRWIGSTSKQAIMPVAVLGLVQGASMTRFVRSAVLEVIRLDYINTARAKGLSERVTILKHVVRNALIPVVTLIALQIPGIFTGAVITEQIFRVPGIGSLLISSILANDTPVIMAITFVFSCLVVLFNLVADLLYGWLDPRISYR